MLFQILLFVLGLFFVALCLLLILLVLIQPSKSGGMGGLAGGAAGGAISETLGATEGEKQLARWTAIGMTVFFVMCLGLTLMANRGTQRSQINLPSAAQQAPAGAATLPEGVEIIESPAGATTIEVPVTGGEGGSNVITIPAGGTDGDGGGTNVITIPAAGTEGGDTGTE